MTRNVGSTDRIVRVLIGVVALIVAFAGMLTLTWSWVVGIVGGVLLLTGAVGFSPVYRLFGGGPTDKTPKGQV